MKSLAPLFALLLVSALAGCSGPGFRVGEPIDEQIVQGSPLPSALGYAFPIPLNVDLSAETAARGTGPARHVYLDSLVLRITATKEPAGDTDNFDFLDRVDVFVESTKAGSTLPRVRIAHLDPVPNGARTLSFETDGVDLIDYIHEGAKLSTSASGSIPPDDTSFDGHIELSVHVL